MSKKDNFVENTVHDYMNPEYVYIPIEDGFKITVREGDRVLKESVIMKSDNREIYSPISGTIIGKTSSLLLNNQKVSSLVIENDYKEEVKKLKGVKRHISDYSKKELVELIKSYKASKADFDKRINTLIVNGIDKDPYEKTRSYMINTYPDKILETIDALINVFDVKETLFAVNNNDTNNVVNLSSHIGTYPNIRLRLLPNVYPMGFSSILLKHLISKKQIDEGALVLSIEDIYNIYTVLKRRKPITEKIVTISGNSLDNSMVVRVKIGTSMQDIIKHVCKVANTDYYVIVNGLISGMTLTNLNSIITLDTRSIFLNTIDDKKEVECINCGLCNLKCPVHLNPKYIREHKSADKSKCIQCGLCTFICPSKINFKPYVGGYNEE